MRTVAVYPSFYRVGVSSLSIHMLYNLLNSMDDVLCERAFYDSRLHPSAPPVSIESRRRLKNFNIIFFSVHYELDYRNIVEMLIQSSIPPLNKDRGVEDPIVVIGGPPVTANPEPLADIADVIVIGEMEHVLPLIVEAAFYGKKACLEMISHKRGIYCPSIDPNGYVSRFWLSQDDFSRGFHPVIQVQSDQEEYYPIYGRSLLVEVTRGCGYWCRFCLLGYNFLPPRHRDFEYLKSLIDTGLKENDVNKVVLISSSLLSHPKAEELLEWLTQDIKVGFSAPSIRLDTLDKENLQLLRKGGQRTLTIAPEAGTDNLRTILGKNFENSLVVDVAKNASEAGFRNIKLYFIIGSPWESKRDLEAIVELTRTVMLAGFSSASAVRVSINPLIPKAHTPMQWVPMLDLKELRNRLSYVSSALSRAGIRVEYLDPRLAVIQAVLSLGDRSLSETIVYWAMYGGGLGGWRRALKRANVALKRIFDWRSIEEALPWDHIDIGVSKKVLIEEYFNMIMGKHVTTCPSRCSVCRLCG